MIYTKEIIEDKVNELVADFSESDYPILLFWLELEFGQKTMWYVFLKLLSDGQGRYDFDDKKPSLLK